MNDKLHEQKVPKEMMKKFHTSMQYCINQWTVCHEAWPLRTQPKQPHNYVCSRCSRDKSGPKKFSQELFVSSMSIQNQELPIIVFTIAGKDNKSRDFLVRRQKVSDARYWLTGTNENGEPNNHLHQNITIDNERLKALLENNTLSTTPKIDLVENTDSDEDQVNTDVGPVDPDDNERVYNNESEMSSVLPTNVNRKKEKDIIDENFLDHTIKHNWNVGSEPLNKFSVQYLASMSFSTLFPDGKGDPTHDAIIYNTSDNITEAFALKLNHLIKFGENIDGK